MDNQDQQIDHAEMRWITHATLQPGDAGWECHLYQPCEVSEDLLLKTRHACRVQDSIAPNPDRSIENEVPWSMDKALILLKYVGIVKCINVSIQCLSWPVSIQPKKLILTSPFFSCSIFALIFPVKSTNQRHIRAQQRSRPADNQRFSSCLTLCGELSTLIQPGTKHLQCSHTYAKLTRLKRKDMPSSH